MTASLKDKYAIVGIGQTPVGKLPEMSDYGLQMMAILNALDDGLRHGEAGTHLHLRFADGCEGSRLSPVRPVPRQVISLPWRVGLIIQPANFQRTITLSNVQEEKKGWAWLSTTIFGIIHNEDSGAERLRRYSDVV